MHTPENTNARTDAQAESSGFASRQAKPTRRGALGCAAVMLVVGLAYYGVQAALRNAPLRAEPMIIAHRGGPRYGPENTLAAFRTAIAQGAEGLEFDVQMSRDGALVVLHDETVDRTTNGKGAVGDLTLEQLRSLDAGGGQQIPTIDEVIQLAKASGVTILPEVKSAHVYPGIEAKIVAALQAANYVDHAIVLSFEDDSLEKLDGLDPNLRLCALYGSGEFNVDTPPGGAQLVCPEAEMILLDPGIIRRAHGEGRQVLVWFLAFDNPVVIRAVRFFGADGVISNDPAAAMRALRGP